MFADKSFFEIMQIGGFTLWVLMIISVISLAIIIERTALLRKALQQSGDFFFGLLKNAMDKGGVSSAKEFAASSVSPLGRIAKAALDEGRSDEQSRTEAMNDAVKSEIARLEKGLSIVGSIGGTVVYVGLFGTVLGIMDAFREIAMSASAVGGMTTVITGISEALICTAAGIAVAVPSVVAYNLISSKIEEYRTEMELFAGKLLRTLRK